MGYLPQSNDPGCSAGFAHGMVTAIAPDKVTAVLSDGAFGRAGCPRLHSAAGRRACAAGAAAMDEPLETFS